MSKSQTNDRDDVLSKMLEMGVELPDNAIIDWHNQPMFYKKVVSMLRQSDFKDFSMKPGESI